MKVVCNIDTRIFNFTKGKIYEVLTAPHDYFFAWAQDKYIIDDKGYKIKYSEYTEYMFTPLESIRQDKINQLIK
jgi:hypothetical protein